VTLIDEQHWASSQDVILFVGMYDERLVSVLPELSPSLCLYITNEVPHPSCQASAKQIHISNFRLTSVSAALTLYWRGSHMPAITNVDSIVEFAVYLQQSLLGENQGVNDFTVHLNSLPLSHNDLSSSDRVKLNKRGVALWNICGRLRITEQHLSRNELLCQGVA